MIRTLKRMTALLLALSMMLSLWGGSVWAAEQEESAEVSVSAAADDAPEQEPEESEPEAALEVQAAEEQKPEESAEPEYPAAEQAEPEETEKAEPEKEEFQLSGVVVNPLYADLFRDDDAEPPEEALVEEQASAATYTKVKDAGAAVRKKLKQRTTNFTVKLKSSSNNVNKLQNSVLTEAFRHTGVPTEGDYLYGQWRRYWYNAKGKKSKGKYTISLTYRFQYFTTAAQEKKVTDAATKLLTKMNLKGKSDFVKVRTIYRYLCNNIVYDEAGSKDDSNVLCHSAYAALIKKKAVCQGYAMLLYRLALASGVDCRYVTGVAYDQYGNSEGHAWNIVRLGKKYYNVDSTWDAGETLLSYFLLCNKNFKNHYRDAEYNTTAFNKAYPMSSTDSDSHYWNSSYTVDKQPTCTEKGSKSIHCADCKKKKSVTAVPALGHDWEYYDEDDDYYYFECSRCGEYGGLERSLVSTQSADEPDAEETTAPEVIPETEPVIAPAPDLDAVQPVRPAKPCLLSAKSAAHKGITVKWKASSGAEGYEIQFARDKGFSKGVRTKNVSGGTVKATVKGTKRGKTYYVRVRARAGKNRSKWSGTKKVRV